MVARETSDVTTGATDVTSIESVEGCGLGESPKNLSFIALGDFKEL